MAVGTAEAAVIITSLIFPFKCINPVLFLMKLLAGQSPHRVAVIEIILGIHLFFHQILVLRQIQIFHCKLIRQINHQRVPQFLVKICLNRFERPRKILLPAQRHCRKALASALHQP